MSAKEREQSLAPQRETQNLSPLEIIDVYRDEFNDHTSIDPLDMEFPYLSFENTHLLAAGDNTAGAFKWRGALVGALHLQEQGYNRLVVPSAGNHARGAILAAKSLNMLVDVVVPTSAPRAKSQGLRELWSNGRSRVHVAGATFDRSLEHAHRLVAENGGALLHPYDDEAVVAGQGTLTDDTLRLQPDVDHIVLPVGGGGLMAGVLNRLQTLGRADIHVTAVQAPGSNSMERSRLSRQLVEAEEPNQLYGGSAVQLVGNQALLASLAYPNLSIVTADQDDINHVVGTYEQSRNDLMRSEKYFVPSYEPTSLVAVAGLYQVAHQYDSTVVIGTGHNAPLY